MIRYLADTNIIGYFTRQNYPHLHQRLELSLRNNELAISVVTRAETRYGQALLNADDKRQATIDLLLEAIPTLLWTTQAADLYGKISATLRKTGQPIGDLDVMIAAHALAENLILVTHNTKHFERIEGLKMEDWTKA
jgi:tRNA(fMet)-specific endonuclease VapC